MGTKLLLVTTVESTLTSFLLPFADHFRNRGWIVDGMAAGISGNPESAKHFDHCWEMTWSRHPGDLANLQTIGRIQQIVATRHYDLVHVHTPIASFLTRWALNQSRTARATGVDKAASAPRVIYTAHGFHCHPGGPPLTNALFYGLEKTALPWTDVLVVINHEDERMARRLAANRDTVVVYMPGIGIDLGYYSRSRVGPDAVRSVRAELNLGAEDVLLLMIAALNPGKRHVDALRALHLLQQPHVHLALAGTGPLAEQLQETIKTLGLQQQVHLLGERQDIPALLAAASALLLPSEREGLPRSVLEAMAMETPVIGTRIRGTEELLDGGAGLLTKVGDVAELAKAIHVTLSQPETTQTRVKLAAKRVKRYSLPRILELHEELYGRLLDERRESA